jgi:RecB family exonuclease
MKHYYHHHHSIHHIGSSAKKKNCLSVVVVIMIIANIISIRPHVVVTSAFSLRQHQHQQQKNKIINNLMKKKTTTKRIGMGACVGGNGGGGFAVASSRMMHYYSSSSSTSLSTRLGMTSSRHSDIEFSTDNDDETTQQQQEQEQQEEKEENILLHPDDFGPIPYPKHLSPSSAMAFKECPQSFLFQYLYKIKQPTNHVLAKGSMCHSALEHIFDLEPKDRTIENLHNMLRVAWAENRLEDEYRFLFERENENENENEGGGEIINNNDDGSSSNSNSNIERDIEAEIEWGQSALQLLDNYYRSEDPRTIQRPNPHKREVWVNANLSIDPNVGVTANANANANVNVNNNNNNNDSSSQQQQQQPAAEESSFKVRGIIDRIDMVRESSRKVALKIIDYKSGKAPNLKYSPSMNQHIFQKNFYQLKIYALLLREKNASAANGAANNNNDMDLRYLKLHYLNSENGRAKPWEMDLGETQDIRDAELNEVHRDLSQIWMDISSLVQTQDPNAFVGCDRSFCFCHVCRDRFVPGTVWEKPSK